MKKLLPMIVAISLVFALASCKTPPPPTPTPPPVVVEESSPPELTVELSPQPFSPDEDGEDDTLTVNISVKTEIPIHSWHIEIREPAPGYALFSEWKGEGMPPKTMVWNGLSASEELVQSATDYHFALVVTNTNNDSTTYQGTISVDVLVRREGDVLRVIVPSIVFASDTGNFSKLTKEISDANDRILRRIAQVLNRYDTYQVKVEGHANPTTAPGTAARTNEEKGTRSVKGLQPLSEERAKAVLDYLVTLGVEKGRLSSVGVGGARTVVEFADKDNWWKNRRVEFILIK